MASTRRRSTLATLLAALALAWPLSAEASEADRLFQLGRRASEMGKFATACSLFRESHRLEPAVGTLLNLGDCEDQQNHIAAALEYYKDALSRLSVTDDRLGNLRERIEGIERRSGTLELVLGDGAPLETQIAVDGEAIPPAKRKKLLLPAGGHLVQVTAVGYRGSRQQVDIVAGSAKRLIVWPGPQLEATELALLTNPSSEDVPAETRRESRAQTLRVAGFALMGAGAASLWVGSLTGLFAIDRESLRKENCDATNQCNQVGFDAARSGSTFATVATYTLAAGALATAGGLVLVLTNRTKAPDKVEERREARAPRNPLARSALVALPSRSGATVTFEHSF